MKVAHYHCDHLGFVLDLPSSITQWPSLSEKLTQLDPSLQIVSKMVYKNRLAERNEQYDVILITGSRASVHDANKKPWIAALLKDIQYRYKHHETRLIGICFGHQAISKALGGELGTLAQRHWQVDKVHFNAEASALANTDKKLLYLHEDYVKVLPQEATLLGSCDRDQNTMYKIGDKVLSCQFHPDYNAQDMRILTQILASFKTATAYQKSLVKKSHSDELIKYINEFIHKIEMKSSDKAAA